MTLPDESEKRFIAILNKKAELGCLMNALGHMASGLAGATVAPGDIHYLQYEDKDGGLHKNIPHYPFIVLKADNSNQIRTVRNECLARGVAFTDFTSTMTVGTSQEQLDHTRTVPEAELEYYGIVMFGKTADLREFTKKFSLFN